MRPPRWAWPTSYRARIAWVIAFALLVMLGAQAAIRELVDARVRDAAERTLTEQAQAIAVEVDGSPIEAKSDRASDAGRFLPDTRIVVRWEGPGGLYVKPEQLERVDVEATARSGEVVVRLQRGPPRIGLSDWLVVALSLAGAALTAAVVWALATALSRRLRRQAAGLATTAEAVAEGDLTVRAADSDDELGRVAAAFNRMAERLDAADERQRRFLADIAHELRTPVTAIDGFASALVDGAATTPEARDEAVGYIREEAARLRELITDLRELTALDLEQRPAWQPVDLAEAGRDAVARFAPMAERAGVQLQAPVGHATIATDRTHLDTVLANLVRNAVTATPAGGRVTIEASVDAGRGRIAVLDTGVGIAPEHLPRIFDRLYRIDSARTRDGGGSGLGLAIVKQLVEDILGGTITVTSAPGQGSTFVVSLPAEPVGLPDG